MIHLSAFKIRGWLYRIYQRAVCFFFNSGDHGVLQQVYSEVEE